MGNFGDSEHSYKCNSVSFVLKLQQKNLSLTYYFRIFSYRGIIMPKYIILGLVFFVIVNGYIFSDDDVENVFPKNTITVDMGLTVSTLITWGIIGDTVFGTAIQYERQVLNKISLASRFEYRVISISSSDSSRTTTSSFSAEGHGRYFPGEGIFFLDGMLGYANFNYRDEAINSISHYFKLGAKLGWRIDFGKPGGLVLEPAIGYYWAIGKNNDIAFLEGSDEFSSFFNQLFNQYYEYIIKGYFVGGLQVSLGLGYRF